MTATAPRKKLTTSAMIASFADPGQPTTSAPFGHALARLGEERPEIVGLSADLAKYTDMHIFREAHPQRFFQMGMAEQALLGAAAGLAEVGLVPFASTYSVFATRRAYDFLCLDIAEPGLNVNVAGGLPGLTTGYGPSHQATEDMAILRGCPGLTIVDPCDAVDIEQAVPALASHPGPTYMRLLRGAVPRVLDEYNYHFELGKAAELRTGRDVVLISTGLMTMRALQAAARLEADSVDVSVLHVPTIKPLDRDAILRVSRGDRLVVTCENHTVIGGLAEAVDEGEEMPVTFFGELADHREIQRGGISQIDAELVVAVFQHVMEGGTAPVLCSITVGRGLVFEAVALVGLGVAPAKAAALIDRMQRVDEDEPARQVEPVRAAALAEAADEVVFGQAREALADQPVHQAQAGREFHTLLWRAIVTSKSLAPFNVSRARPLRARQSRQAAAP